MKTSFVAVAILGALTLPACTTTEEAGSGGEAATETAEANTRQLTPSQARQATISAPTVPETIRAGVRYPATVTVNLPPETRVDKIAWFWSGEGPFSYPLNMRGNRVTSRLRTGNPGQYNLQAELCMSNRLAQWCQRSPGTWIEVR